VKLLGLFLGLLLCLCVIMLTNSFAGTDSAVGNGSIYSNVGVNNVATAGSSLKGLQVGWKSAVDSLKSAYNAFTDTSTNDISYYSNESAAIKSYLSVPAGDNFSEYQASEQYNKLNVIISAQSDSKCPAYPKEFSDRLVTDITNPNLAKYVRQGALMALALNNGKQSIDAIVGFLKTGGPLFSEETDPLYYLVCLGQPAIDALVGSAYNEKDVTAKTNLDTAVSRLNNDPDFSYMLENRYNTYVPQVRFKDTESGKIYDATKRCLNCD
jgi:hypothetical protein